MATRHEAKLAIWAASKKDDKARAYLTQFLNENSEDRPGGYVPNDALARALKAVK